MKKQRRWASVRGLRGEHLECRVMLTAFSVLESPIYGVVSDDHSVTHASDDVYQQITEVDELGEDVLSHGWEFAVSSGIAPKFVVEAKISAEPVVFSYSLDGLSFQNMLTVSELEERVYEFELPPEALGTVWVKASDTALSDAVLDSLWVDQMYIETTLSFDPPGLVGHWTLDEASIGQPVVDSSPLNNHGVHVNVNLPEGPNDVAAVGSQSLRVDGIDDFVSIGPNPSLDLSAGQFTQSVWIFPEHTESGFRGILGNESAGSASRYPSLWVKDQTKIHAGFGDGTEWNGFSTGSVLTPFEWNHIVATFDANEYKIYVNGTEVHSTLNFAGKLPAPVQQVDIGRVNSHFQGLIDDVRIYTRPLNAAEVVGLTDLGPSSPGTIQLADNLYVVNEANGTVDIEVVRVDGDGGTVTVDYSLIDRSAVASQDYTNTTGSVTFLDGQTTALITVPILDDSAAEDNETFTVSLDAVGGGAELGALTTRTVTILVSDSTDIFDQTGLVGHWKLDEAALGQGVVDNSPLGNHGDHVNVNSPQGPNNIAAVGSRSLRVDGIDDYVSIGPDPRLDLSAGQFTQSVWIFPEHTDSGFFGILGNESAGSASRYPSVWVKDQTKIHAGFGDGTAWNGFSTGSVLTPFEWNHIVATFDGDEYKIYVNGTAAYSTLNLSGKLPTPVQQVDIGRVNSHFQGLIDDVRIYTRSLDAAEVLGLTGLGPSSPGTIQMADNRYVVNEADGTVDIEVVRVDGDGGMVTVDYSLVDVSAVASQDYTDITGSVTFFDGQTTALITVPILDDTAEEGNETFTVSLDAVGGGAELGAPTSRTVTILASDSTDTFDQTGLVGHWQLDDAALGQGVVDNSPLGNHGDHVNVNLPQGPDNVAAVGSQSLRVDGIDDYVSIGPDPSLDLSAGQFTQSVWIFPEHTESGFHGILGNESAGSASRYPSLWVKDQTKIHAGFGDGTEWNGFSTGSVLSPFEWNHIATTFDTNEYKIYVNGTEVYSTLNLAGKLPAPVQQVDIGRVNSHFQGLIDDVRIYTRPLDAAEVLGLTDLGPSSPGKIQLADKLYVVNESDGTVDIEIIRIDGDGGTVTVDYSLLDGSAVASQDYTDITGSVTFLDGQTTALITVPILDDTAEEGNETFTVSLDAVGGSAELGALITRTVTILASDFTDTFDETGLVGHWQLDDAALGQGVVDNSPLGNHGDHVNVNSPQGPNNIAAVGSQSLRVDGVDDYVSIGPNPSLDLSAGQFTQSVWIFPEHTEAGFHGILGNESAGSASRYPSLWVKDQTKIHAGFGDGTEWNGFSTGSVLTPFEWNHIVATFDGGEYKIFVNGSEAYSTFDLSGKLPIPVQQVDIGRVNSHFRGLIDDVRIYTRPLNSAEVIGLTDLGPSSPGTIQMADRAYTVNELDGTVDIEVVRVGGDEGVVTVDFTSVDGSAIASEDYTAVSGAVTFLDGETSAWISVPILDDHAGEGNETFSVSLDATGGGAGMGFPRTRLITLVDNDAPAGTGTGLWGEYFQDPHFAEFVFARNDATVDFDWGQGSPEPAVDADTFSVRWSGLIEPVFSETYTFFAMMDDGVRLWIDGQQVIDQWATPTGGTAFGTIDLTAGQRYDIVIDYFEDTGDASVKLEWSSSSQAREVIPTSRLYEGDATQPAISFAATLTQVEESVGTGAIPVVRVGDLSAPASVEYFLTDETAVAGVDYTAVSGVLDFAVGQASQTIVVPILNDLDSEPNETLGLTLSNATGAILGTQDVSQLKILDDDAGDFLREEVINGLFLPTTFEFAPDGRMFVAQKWGQVLVYGADGVQQSTFIDISAEVNHKSDRGLLGLELHPDFPTTPYVYLAYAYDPPETQGQTGNAGPDGEGNRVNRMIRVSADPATGYSTAIPGSEVVILGANSTWANISSPELDSTGDISIPPSCGPGGALMDCLPLDSRSHAVGAVEFSADGQALFVSVGDGTSFGIADPRSVRVQDLDSLSGKLLRIDPITGEGLPDNPFYNGDPSANRSKVYSYGLRNPFRFAIHPITGEPYIGDVGWTSWEEINTGAGANFGWPYFEGGNGTSVPANGYSELPEAQAFYASSETVEAPIFSRSHIDGATALILGDFYSGNTYPSAYEGALFFTDVNEGSIHFLTFDAQGNAEPVRNFETGIPGIVHMTMGPDGNLYVTNIATGKIERFVPDSVTASAVGSTELVDSSAADQNEAFTEAPDESPLGASANDAGSDAAKDQVFAQLGSEHEAKPVLGDINGDQRVDFDDFLILSAHFGTSTQVDAEGSDLNGDGKVGFADFLILSKHFEG